jgi:hypothetical protein
MTRARTDNQTDIARTTNEEDSIAQQESADGYNALADVELLGETLADGILAYISASSLCLALGCLRWPSARTAIGVNASFVTQWSNENAWTPAGSATALVTSASA